MEPQVKRQRKANWGDDESLQLAMLYRDEVHILRMRFKNEGVSNKKKHDIWEKITTELNTQFSHGRTAVEVKKRWFTICSKSRTKIQKFKEYRNGTGGGPEPAPLDPIDKIVEDILGEGNQTIMGIEGIEDIGLQKTTDLEDKEPSLDLSIGDGGTEAPTALAVGASNIVPEPAQATLQPFEVPAEDGAPVRMTVAGLEEEAAAARARAAAAEEEAEAARSAARTARAQEEAARAMKAAAEEVAACVRALAGAARAGEAAERAREVAEKRRQKPCG